MNPWLYALLCVVVPIVWGLLVAWASGLIESRAGQPRGDAAPLAQDDRV